MACAGDGHGFHPAVQTCFHDFRTRGGQWFRPFFLQISFHKYIPELTQRDGCIQVLGVKIPADYSSEECRKFLDDLCAQKEKEAGEIFCPPPRTIARLIDKVWYVCLCVVRAFYVFMVFMSIDSVLRRQDIVCEPFCACAPCLGAQRWRASSTRYDSCTWAHVWFVCASTSTRMVRVCEHDKHFNVIFMRLEPCAYYLLNRSLWSVPKNRESLKNYIHTYIHAYIQLAACWRVFGAHICVPDIPLWPPRDHVTTCQAPSRSPRYTEWEYWYVIVRIHTKACQEPCSWICVYMDREERERVIFFTFYPTSNQACDTHLCVYIRLYVTYGQGSFVDFCLT